MEAIIISNKIKLVHDYSQITITLRVPALNIEKMKDLLNCAILSKKEIELTHKHNACKVFSVTIRVKFSTIKQYLMRESCHECENKAEYLNLIGLTSLFYATYHEQNLMCENVALYAFGDCRTWAGSKNFNTIYTNANGHKISLVQTKQNNFGKKRYINFKGQWYSNKKY